MGDIQKNKPVEVWRQDLKDSSDPDNFKASTIFVDSSDNIYVKVPLTQNNEISIVYKGTAINATAEEWHNIFDQRIKLKHKVVEMHKVLFEELYKEDE